MNFNPALTTQRGIALLSVLVVSLILTLLISGATAMLNKRMALAIDAKQQLAEKMLAHAVKNELTYLIATQRTTRAGVSKGTNPQGASRNDAIWALRYIGDEIRVDGFEYSRTNELATVHYSIQAVNGLIPVNSSAQNWLNRWLYSTGMDNYTAARYTDALADYADPDDWSRPAGGERRSYLNRGMAPPTNFLLQHCGELYDILHWHDNPDLVSQLQPFCGLRRSASVNLNAIPAPLLHQLWPNLADQILAERANGEWILGHSQAQLKFNDISGMTDDFIRFIAGSRFKIQIKTGSHVEATELTTGTKLLPPYTERPLR
ncbi:type II secretion system protein GspK [Alteromonas gilva]|uniref:Type II secretion system protein GspK n=1 Tax=Alteromonas gilva TaxID=2987522 RepID=A0ABT5L7I3_9ALTE|nr:type II secretion system protein GspK [Alteromonas gilva]MDC8833010.1 type II secretion system protein GspK [Alteromonas gilva]